jgi:hypothetical protein
MIFLNNKLYKSIRFFSRKSIPISFYEHELLSIDCDVLSQFLIMVIVIAGSSNENTVSFDIYIELGRREKKNLE